MLNVEVTAHRYFSELPIEKHEIKDLKALESFFLYVLQSEEHYVSKIHCPDQNRTFEIEPPDFCKSFMAYAKELLNE